MHVQLLAETKLLSKDADIELGTVINDDRSCAASSINSNLEDIGTKETYQNEIKKITYFDRVLHLVRIPRVRRSAMAAFAIMSLWHRAKVEM